MKQFHINQGMFFARPGESKYAQLRRCLVANPGIPLSAIEYNLRQSCPRYSSTTDRLKDLGVNNYQFSDFQEIYQYINYRRQCPQCAKLLYHSSIYILPWITHCPIHKCPLTTICLKCNRPWPSTNEIAKRDCPDCGIFALDKISQPILSEMHQLNTDPILDVFHLLKDTDYIFAKLNSEYDEILNIEFDWWQNVPLLSEYFPSFQSRIKSKSFREKLNKANLVSHKIDCKITNLTPVTKAKEKSENNWQNGIEQNILTDSLCHFKIEYTVTRRIISWASKHSAAGHKLTITSYRYLGLKELIDAPLFCPYCMAFSLWFFNVAAKHYRRSISDRVNDYPFLIQSQYDFFLNVCNPVISIRHKNDCMKYIPEKQFSEWFYQRGLETSFIDIVGFLLYMREQIEIHKNNHTSDYQLRLNLQKFDRLIPCRFCLPPRINSKLYYYYLSDRPLNHFSTQEQPDADKSCQTYQEYHKHNKLDANRITFSNINSTELRYDLFIELHEQFQAYLQEIWNSNGYTCRDVRYLWNGPDELRNTLSDINSRFSVLEINKNRIDRIFSKMLNTK